MTQAVITEVRNMNQENPQSSNMTKGGYGETMRNSLLRAGNYEYFADVGSERSVLSENEVAAAMKLKPERELVAYLTPYFQAVCDEVDTGMSFVNSENVAWLPTPSGNDRRLLKPDFTIIHGAMASLQNQSVASNFGSPVLDVIESLRVVGEVKLKLDDEGFGELCCYTEMIAQQFGPDKGTIIRGIALDPSRFILVESNSSAPFKAIEGSLSAPGSLELIKKFIGHDDPLTRSFTLLCDALQVREHHNHVSSEGRFRSFLGKGRSGRAFVVTGLDHPGTSVLKVVVSTDNFEKTREEFRRLHDARNASPNHVVRVKVDSFRNGEFLIGTIKYFYHGYLMEEVGRPMQSEHLEAEDRELICRSLNALHLDGIYHGDARIPNVVNCGGHFKWIDLHHRVSPSADIAMIYDVKTLFESMFSPRCVDWHALSPLLKQYGETCAVDHMLEILRTISFI